jgi:hypothetical protein
VEGGEEEETEAPEAEGETVRVPRLRERLLRVRRAEMRGQREEQMRSRKGEGTEEGWDRRISISPSDFVLSELLL